MTAGSAFDKVRRFLAAERGIAAIEFAFILPVLLAILLAGTQLVIYINATRKVGQVARSISQMISQIPPQPGMSTANATAADVRFSLDSTMVIFPYVLSDAKRQNINWTSNISINIASIYFSQGSGTCGDPADQSGCYTAFVVWTTAGAPQPGGPNYRSCVTPQQAVSNTAPPNRANLPRSVYGPSTLIVVDVVFNFTPIFASKFIPPIRIARTVYIQPRYATLINFDTTTNDGIGAKCPGF